MASAGDRRAALLLGGLALVGLAVRMVAAGGGAPGAVAYRFGVDAGPGRDSLAAAAARLARPLEPGEVVDVDRAPAGELTRLPRIGPGLAARIVADREANGPFGSLDGLARVPGVGEVTLKGLARFVVFSGRPRTPPPTGPRDGRVAVNTATVEELDALPGIGPALARAIVEERARGGAFRSADDLERVPGIGPALVRRLTTRIRIP
jgi:competence ComEA-like helix-hairpin-helix protein